MSENEYVDPELAGLMDGGGAPVKPDLSVDEGPSEKSREEAFQQPRLEWRGRDLVPSIGRYSCFMRLRTVLKYAPIGDALRLLRSKADAIDAFYPDAALLVYVCGRTEEEIDFMPAEGPEVRRELEGFMAATCPLHEIDVLIITALRCWNSFHANQHEVAPAKRGHGDDVGN